MKIILSFLLFQLISLTIVHATVVQYTYDQFGQVSTADYSDSTLQEYDYDAIGNRVSHSTLLNVPGDVNGDHNLDLSDAILALQICSGHIDAGKININADINSTENIDMAEAVFILQRIGNL